MALVKRVDRAITLERLEDWVKPGRTKRVKLSGRQLQSGWYRGLMAVPLNDKEREYGVII